MLSSLLHIKNMHLTLDPFTGRDLMAFLAENHAVTEGEGILSSVLSLCSVKTSNRENLSYNYKRLQSLSLGYLFSFFSSLGFW